MKLINRDDFASSHTGYPTGYASGLTVFQSQLKLASKDSIAEGDGTTSDMSEREAGP